MKDESGWGLSSNRRYIDSSYRDIFDLHVLRRHLTEMTNLFACVRPIMDMKFVQGGYPSFLKLIGNVPIGNGG